MYDTGYKLEVRRVPHRLRVELHRAGRRAAAEGAVSWIRALPNEEAGSNAGARQRSSSGWAGRRPACRPTRSRPTPGRRPRRSSTPSTRLPGPDLPRRAARPAAIASSTYDAGGFFGPIQLGQEAEQRLRHRHAGRRPASGSASPRIAGSSVDGTAAGRARPPLALARGRRGLRADRGAPRRRHRGPVAAASPRCSAPTARARPRRSG